MSKTIGSVHAETFETRVSDDRSGIVLIMTSNINKNQKFSYIYSLDRDQMVQLRDFINERLQHD